MSRCVSMQKQHGNEENDLKTKVLLGRKRERNVSKHQTSLIGDWIGCLIKPLKNSFGNFLSADLEVKISRQETTSIH